MTRRPVLVIREGEQIFEAFFVNRDDAVQVASCALDHLLPGHDELELASSRKTHRNILRIRRDRSRACFRAWSTRSPAKTHVSDDAAERLFVAVQGHSSPCVRVERRMQIDARQGVLAVAIHADVAVPVLVDRPS